MLDWHTTGAMIDDGALGRQWAPRVRMYRYLKACIAEQEAKEAKDASRGANAQGAGGGFTLDDLGLPWAEPC